MSRYYADSSVRFFSPFTVRVYQPELPAPATSAAFNIRYFSPAIFARHAPAQADMLLFTTALILFFDIARLSIFHADTIRPSAAFVVFAFRHMLFSSFCQSERKTCLLMLPAMMPFMPFAAGQATRHAAAIFSPPDVEF